MNTELTKITKELSDAMFERGRTTGLVQASIYLLTCGKIDPKTAVDLSNIIPRLPDDSKVNP